MSNFCQQCGEPLTLSDLDLVDHECAFEQLLWFQVQCARIEMENGLEAQVAAWAREPRLAKRLAFARYVRDRPTADTIDEGRRAA